MSDSQNERKSRQKLQQRLKSRNLALAAVLAGLVILFFAVTIVRVQQGSEQRGNAPLIINR
ncbi:MAG: hypothetical protein ACK4NA_02075 [Alphaproteobacteria bacterium]